MSKLSNIDVIQLSAMPGKHSIGDWNGSVLETPWIPQADVALLSYLECVPH